MLRGVSCRNFRCFREETTFPLAPLTVLVGPNNAGKSTVVDLIRLLARGNTYEDIDSGVPFRSKDELFELDFRLGDHRLSSFDRLLTSGQKTLKIGIQFDLPFRPESEIQITNGISIHRTYEKDGSVVRLKEMEGFLLPTTSKEESVEVSKSRRRRFFRIEYEYRSTVTPGHPSAEISHTYPAYWEAEYDFDSGGVEFEHVEEEVTRHEMGAEGTSRATEVSYEAVLDPPLVEIALAYANMLRDRRGKPRIDVTPQSAHAECDFNHPSPREPKFFGNHFIDILEPPAEWSESVDDKTGFWNTLKKEILAPLAESINRWSRISTTYAPSFRAVGQAYYGPSDPLTDLLRSFDGENPPVKRQVNEWIENLDLGRDLQVDREGPSLYRATIERNGQRRPLSDCGSGVAQLLPLILQFTQAGRQDVLLVEEPEANLHPDLQARLADLFGELAERRTAVVETHSEYFVRRIQYLIARGEVDPDMVQLLYIEPPDDQSSSQVQPISIDEQGQLSEPFGPGFFDQATDLMVDLFKYGSEN